MEEIKSSTGFFKCPECDSQLKEATTVRLKGAKGVNILGYHKFCTNMDCRYESEDYKRNNGFRR